MDIDKFWDFLQAIEAEYARCRRSLTARYSLTAAEADVLMFLANNPRFDTAAQISRIRRIPKSQVSVSVASLCEMGLLTRSYAPGDRKSVHLAPSDAAAPVIACGHAAQQEFAESLFSALTEEERAEYFRLHEKIARSIEKQGGKNT